MADDVSSTGSEEIGSLKDFIADEAEAEAEDDGLFAALETAPKRAKPDDAVNDALFVVKLTDPRKFLSFVKVAASNVPNLSIQIKKAAKSSGFTGIQIVCANTGFSVLAQGRYECVIVGEREEINDLKVSVDSKSFLLVLSEMCKNSGMSSSVIMSQKKDALDKLRFEMTSIEHQTALENEISLVEDNSVQAEMFDMFKIEDPFTASIKLDVFRDFVNFAMRAKSSFLGLQLTEASSKTIESITHFRVRMNFKSDSITGKNDLFINVKHVEADDDEGTVEIVSSNDYSMINFEKDGENTYYQEFPVINVAALLKDMHTDEIQVSMCNDSPLLLVSNYTSKTYWRVYLSPNSVSEAGPKKASRDEDDD